MLGIAVALLAAVGGGRRLRRRLRRRASGLTVVATTTQVADLVREVGGDRVNVEGMLRPGGDPHDYEPRPSDVAPWQRPRSCSAPAARSTTGSAT